MSRIVHLNNSPWKHSCTNFLPLDFNNIFRTDDSKGHQAAKLVIFLNCVFIIFFNVVWEIINWNLIMIYVVHDEFFRGGEFLRSERIGFSNDGNNVDARR